ncbi:hypothetical protein [Persephonella sp.]
MYESIKNSNHFWEFEESLVGSALRNELRELENFGDILVNPYYLKSILLFLEKNNVNIHEFVYEQLQLRKKALEQGVNNIQYKEAVKFEPQDLINRALNI